MGHSVHITLWKLASVKQVEMKFTGVLVQYEYNLFLHIIQIEKMIFVASRLIGFFEVFSKLM